MTTNNSTYNARPENPELPRLLAFHYAEGHDYYTTLGGLTHVPGLVYEVIETIEGDGRTVYEGRIFDAATREQIHERPYQSTFLAAFTSWWERETGTESPVELLHGVSDLSNREDGDEH
ncbi:hypothetical protein [Rubrobacter aplysinae]|uniref:hypothetical protein n=1 Tax=Rubrobacter aplysinae TaxID=909625 RepID=UPI00064C109B|nr:hypothetical protein [Rubrobacter aplysinae]